MRTLQRKTVLVEARDVWEAQRKARWEIDRRWYIEHIQRVEQIGIGEFRVVCEVSLMSERDLARRGFVDG